MPAQYLFHPDIKEQGAEVPYQGFPHVLTIATWRVAAINAKAAKCGIPPRLKPTMWQWRDSTVIGCPSEIVERNLHIRRSAEIQPQLADSKRQWAYRYHPQYLSQVLESTTFQCSALPKSLVSVPCRSYVACDGFDLFLAAKGHGCRPCVHL